MISLLTMGIISSWNEKHLGMLITILIVLRTYFYHSRSFNSCWMERKETVRRRLFNLRNHAKAEGFLCGHRGVGAIQSNDERRIGHFADKRIKSARTPSTGFILKCILSGEKLAGLPKRSRFARTVRNKLEILRLIGSKGCTVNIAAKPK